MLKSSKILLIVCCAFVFQSLSSLEAQSFGVSLSTPSTTVNESFDVLIEFEEGIMPGTFDPVSLEIFNGSAGELRTITATVHFITITPVVPGDVTIFLPADSTIRQGGGGRNTDSNLLVVGFTEVDSSILNLINGDFNNFVDDTPNIGSGAGTLEYDSERVLFNKTAIVRSANEWINDEGTRGFAYDASGRKRWRGWHGA